jgi:alkyl sulfatase BDS1-like metallo-beta-lactamase superfamily hydrolase
MTDDADTAPKPAEAQVAAANAALLAALPFDDRQDFEDAARGFLGSRDDMTIRNAEGRPVWSLAPYDFLSEQSAPPTVNPSLWRLAQLNCRHGLYEVCEGLYQIRGFDIANMTIVEGETGLIVIDTLTSAETARAALDLYFAHRPRRTVVAVVYTHTHIDHWGGVKGVIDAAEAVAGRIPVIAPDAMNRRGQYQFGGLLAKGERGQVDAALGKAISAGNVGLIAPNDLVTRTGETRTLDGIEFVFQMAPNSEAPAEMHIHLPRFKALNLAENAVHLFHNLLPFRGAEVRDPLAWSKYVNEAIALFGADTEVLLGQHHWPVWGAERVLDYLKVQRDLYKYAHDQTLRLMNHGLGPTEIAETLALPQSIARHWHARGYYGTLRHNSKAIYQKYLGWYDANPASLDPLPRVETARRTIAYMGGAAAVLARARADFAAGDYRWVAQVTSQLVFAEPDNAEARALNADAFEQLGYLAEAATWRNAYLFGAQELRQGVATMRRPAVTRETLKALSVDMIFDFLGVRLNGPRAEGRQAVVNWVFPDTGARYALTLENCALTYRTGTIDPAADVTVTLDRPTLDAVMAKELALPAAVMTGAARIEGNAQKLVELFGLLDEFKPDFPIVEPQRQGLSRSPVAIEP